MIGGALQRPLGERHGTATGARTRGASRATRSKRMSCGDPATGIPVARCSSEIILVESLRQIQRLARSGVVRGDN